MQPEDIKQAVALQRMVAVAATRPNWPSILTSPPPSQLAEQPVADEPAPPPELQQVQHEQ
jgi:hypothetical protein